MSSTSKPIPPSQHVACVSKNIGKHINVHIECAKPTKKCPLPPSGPGKGVIIQHPSGTKTTVTYMAKK
jgi:hypothetical protein